MKVFRVKNEKYGYCDDIECIVIAESEEAILCIDNMGA